MERHSRIAATALLAGSLLILATASAQTAAPQGNAPDAAARGPGPGMSGGGPGGGPRGPMQWGPGRPGGPPPFGPPGGPGRGPGALGAMSDGGLLDPPPFLMGLRLTQEQQDKVFSILYAVAPQQREQSKALRAAREALMKADAADDFNEAAVRRQADAAAKAESELTLLRVRTHHQIYLLLTQEQRVQLEKRRGQRGPHAPGNPPA